MPFDFGISQAILLALCIVSIWLFVRAIDRRLFSLFPWPWRVPAGDTGERIKRVFLEVLFQSRVIRDRPLVGILHALVLWGFIAFAYVSIEHFALGFRGIETATEKHTWYGVFAAAWAIAVLVGILGLMFRRFVLRPKALGKMSPTSAAVDGLIAALMITYLLGFTTLEAGTTGWKINWWAHTLSFLALLVLIPQSKHLHLVLAPFAIFWRSENTSAIRPLREDDEDIGMVRFKDLQWKDVLDVNTCVECGRCTQFCPANISGGTLSPKEIILGMQRGLLGGGEVIAGPESQVAERGAWVTEQDLYQCLSCGACEYVCPVGIEHVGYKIIDLRRGLVSEGRTTNEKVAELFTTMERAPHNPWGIGQDTREKFIAAKQFPIFDGKQEWLFWFGCGLSFDSHGQAVALAMKQILDAAGVSWGVLPRESCCGEPARRAGNEYLYLQLSEKVIELFTESRVKNIVLCDPHCTTMLDKDYRQLASYAELGIRVMHHSEFIAQLLPKLPIQSGAEVVTYHDPCYLARHRGITQEPREILRGCGVSIIEAEYHGKKTFCCGAGGAQLFIADDRRDAQARVNHLRFAQLEKTKAATITVACPYCPIMLRDAAGHANRDDIAILDVAEVVASRLRKAESGAVQDTLLVRHSNSSSVDGEQV
ncbi:MAG: (Fe-S)-binding protein [Terriglobales bacterium]